MLKPLLLMSALTALPPSTWSFHQPQGSVRHHKVDMKTIISRSQLVGLGDAVSKNRLRFTTLCNRINDNSNLDTETQRQRQNSPLMISLMLAGSCLLVSGVAPQPANALPVLNQADHLQEQQNLITLSSSETFHSTRSLSESSLLLLATYSEEGSGGMPFLSPFQTPGAIPSATDPRIDDADARNRAYDDAFDQDKRDRDAYYAKMALQAREKKAQQLKEQRQSLGLDYPDSGPRFGDAEVASMASLKKYLLEKDPATMTPAEFREFQVLTQRESN